jgi:Uma2 family endonuclease
MLSLLTHKFTVEQYHQLSEKEILPPDSRVELINGDILEMSPIGVRHGMTVKRLNAFFAVQLFQKAIISVQDPIQLNDYSEPQPDLALLKFRADFYGDRLPRAEDVLLIIEVADSSYRYDRDLKIPLYAQSGIPEVWLIDLTRQRLLSFSQPQGGHYGQVNDLKNDQIICCDGFPDLFLDLSTILT